MASVYRRGRVWQCAYTDYAGRRRSISLKVHDEKLARQLATALEGRHAMIRLGLASPDEVGRMERGLVDPATLLDRWAATIDASEGHRREQVARVRSFLEAAGVGACCTFAAGDMIGMAVRWLDSAGGAPQTRNKRLLAVRSFGEWLRINRYASSNVTLDVPMAKPDGIRRCPHRALTVPEAKALWAGARGDYYRFRCILGVRGNECLRLTRESVDLGDSPTVTVPGKNKLVITLPLPAGLADVLRDRYEMAAPTTPLFPDVARSRSARRDQWLADRDAARLPAEVNERSLRMTCVTWLRVTGADRLDVLTIRRDRGVGAEALAAHNYSEGSQIAVRIRGVLERLEKWTETTSRGLRAHA